MTIPYASIIILNYNTRDLTLQCLTAFAPALHERGWRIIVVDNGSTDGSAEAVRQHYPFAEVIHSASNLGFAGGNNLGLRQASGEIVFLMNSDVFAPADTLQALAFELQMHHDIGAISAGLRTTTGEAQAFAYGDDPSLGYLLQRGVHALLKRDPLHRWDVELPIETDWVSGACVGVCQAAIRQVGLLDERFQLYFEDIDWCLRMRQAGWKIVYDPRFAVTHLGGASQPQRNIANQLYYQSMVKFYSKHYGPFATWALRGLLLPYKLLIRFRR